MRLPGPETETWCWLGRKESNLRSPGPESSGARGAPDELASPASCSDPAIAASSHLRSSGESGAQPRRESGALARTARGLILAVSLSPTN